MENFNTQAYTERGESTVKRTVGCHGNQGKKGIHLERGLVQVSVRELVWAGFWRRRGLWEDALMLECGPLGWWSVVAAREKCGSKKTHTGLPSVTAKPSRKGTQIQVQLGIYPWCPKRFINANEPIETKEWAFIRFMHLDNILLPNNCSLEIEKLLSHWKCFPQDMWRARWNKLVILRGSH